MSRILVIGGAGFLGSHVVRKFVSRGHSVSVLDAFVQYRRPPMHPLHLLNVNYRGRYLLPEAKVSRCDVRDKGELGRHVRRIQPEYVVTLAGMPTVGLAGRYSEETFATTVGGTVSLLEALRDCDAASKLAVVSSSLVYGTAGDGAFGEDSSTDPTTIEGGMKLAVEQIVKVYSQQYGIPYTIVRPGVVYGPTDNHHREANVFLSRAMAGKTLMAVNADESEYDFSYVEDVAEGIAAATLADEATGQTFNLGCGRSHTIRELAQAVTSLYPDSRVEYVEDAANRPVRIPLDVAKAREVLGYQPEYSLEAGIAKYADYLESAYRSLPQPTSVARRRAA